MLGVQGNECVRLVRLSRRKALDLRAMLRPFIVQFVVGLPGAILSFIVSDDIQSDACNNLQDPHGLVKNDFAVMLIHLCSIAFVILCLYTYWQSRVFDLITDQFFPQSTAVNPVQQQTNNFIASQTEQQAPSSNSNGSNSSSNPTHPETINDFAFARSPSSSKIVPV